MLQGLCFFLAHPGSARYLAKGPRGNWPQPQPQPQPQPTRHSVQCRAGGCDSQQPGAAVSHTATAHQLRAGADEGCGQLRWHVEFRMAECSCPSWHLPRTVQGVHGKDLFPQLCCYLHGAHRWEMCHPQTSPHPWGQQDWGFGSSFLSSQDVG